MSPGAKIFLVLLALLAILAVVALVVMADGGGDGFDGDLRWLEGWAKRAGRGALTLDDLAARPSCVPEGAPFDRRGDAVVVPQGETCVLRFGEGVRPVRRGEVTLARGVQLRLQVHQERYMPIDLALGRGARRPVDVTRSGAVVTLACLQGEPRPDDTPACRVRLLPAR